MFRQVKNSKLLLLPLMLKWMRIINSDWTPSGKPNDSLKTCLVVLSFSCIYIDTCSVSSYNFSGFINVSTFFFQFAFKRIMFLRPNKFYVYQQDQLFPFSIDWWSSLYVKNVQYCKKQEVLHTVFPSLTG